MIIRKFGRQFVVKQYKGENLGKSFSLDCETELVKSPDHIPRLVVSTAYNGGNTAYIILNKDILSLLKSHSDSTIIFHNFFFDMNVISNHCGFIWFNMIESGKIIDTALLFKLNMIATRGYCPEKSSLDYVTKHLLKDVLPKDDSIRLTFGQYLDDSGKVDYKAISKAHYIYAILDPIATFLIYEKLLSSIKLLPTTTLLAHKIHLMGDIALKDIGRTGVGVDLEYTKTLADKYRIPMEKEAEILTTYGWVRGQKGNTDVYAGVLDFLGIAVPTTKTGKPSMAAEDLIQYNREPFVQSFLKFQELEHNLQFLNELTADRIYPWYDTLKVTGRTSCKKPNMQNPPRTGGIRECFIPAKDHVYCDVDYSSIEMFTAAICMKEKGYGHVMYDALNKGLDPHIFAASGIQNIPQSKVTKDQRQQAKAANYGFLANMSAATFIPYAEQYGLNLTLAEATKIKKGWANAYPEVKEFWKAPYKAGGTFVARSGFIRANCAYTEWLNTHFQGRAAEGAKIALYMNYKQGMKQTMFIHDQIIVEAHESEAKDVLEVQKKNMIDGMKLICDMEIQVDGDIKRRFCK